MIESKGLERLGFKPGVDFSLRNDGGDTYIEFWHSASPQPTEAEIEQAWSEHLAEYNANAYAREREAEYPRIEEMIVALWEQVVEGRPEAAQSLEAKRQVVKQAHPKPGA